MEIGGEGPPFKMKKETSIVKENFSFIWSINNFGEFLDRKYEFLSPVFTPNPPGTSKWKLFVFPEIVYPEGEQITLRLLNMSNDDKCYSVNYRLSILDKNGRDNMPQYREKVFRHSLDYDQCFLACNRTIKDKSLLQSNGTLTICCEIDLLFCKNLDDKTPESMKSYENINIPVTNDEKLIKSGNINNSLTPTDLSTINNLTISENINNCLPSGDLSFEILCKNSDEVKVSENISNNCLPSGDLSFEILCKNSDEVKVINGLSENNDSACSAPEIKEEKTHFNKRSSKHHRSFMISPNEYEKKTSGLLEKTDCFLNKTKGNAKRGNENARHHKELDALSQDLNFLYVTKYQYDVTIKTKDGQIRAHKAILAARSEYFRKILVQGKDDFQITGISSATLDAILLYMYTGQSPQITFNLGMDILRVCDQFHLDYLKDVAENSIKSQINISNVTDIFEIATEMELENLKIQALKFIAKNSEAVTNSAKWNEMVNANPRGTREILLITASLKNKLNKR